MNAADYMPDDLSDGMIAYHFDVQSHSIPARQLFAITHATQAILENFSEVLSDGKSKFELRVVSPKPGGLIAMLTVVCVTGGLFFKVC